VIPVGIETKKYHLDDRLVRRKALGIGNEMVCIFVGRMAPVKNVPELVETFLKMQSAGAAVSRLVIVGEGDDAAAVRALLEHHPLRARVTLAGEQVDVRSFLAAAEIFVLNSRSEGTPRALLE